MRRKICPKPGGKDALESQVQPFRKPDRRFKHRKWFEIGKYAFLNKNFIFEPKKVIIKRTKMVFLCALSHRTDVLTGRNIQAIYQNMSDFILVKNHTNVQFVENNSRSQAVIRTI